MERAMIKTFRAEVKSVSESEGLIDMLIPMSTDSMDRDGESIDMGAWKKTLPSFRKRPILLSSHNYGDLRKQIGEFTSIKASEEGLMAKPKYYINEGNEEADWAFNLAQKGMAAFSVGFIPLAFDEGDGKKSPRRTYTEVELLEISQVCVPSNREAMQGHSKSADPVVSQLIEDIEKAELAPKHQDHHKAVVSQEEIADELTYLKCLLPEITFSGDNKALAGTLAQDLYIKTGGKQMDMNGMKKMRDTMADCEKSAGDCKRMAEDMMGAEEAEKRAPGGDTPVDIGEILQAVTQAVKESFQEVK